jgi:hypothetical protein
VQNKERFIPYELFGDNPATRRWFVVSIYRAIYHELEMRGFEEPSQKEIENYIHRAKEATLPWIRIQDMASKLRRKELGELLAKTEKKTLKESLAAALEEIQAKYLEIDKNPETNYSFLDKLVISDGH